MRLPDSHPLGGQVIEHGTEVPEIPRHQAEADDRWRVLAGQAPKPPTVAELKEQAAALGVEAAAKLKKAELVAAIAAAQSVVVETPAEETPAPEVEPTPDPDGSAE